MRSECTLMVLDRSKKARLTQPLYKRRIWRQPLGSVYLTVILDHIMLINKILGTLYHAADQSEALNEILSMAGAVFNASRAYIFELDEAQQYYDNTYEWCREGIAPQKENLINIPRENISAWEKLFKSAEIVRCGNINELDPVSRDILKVQGIKSILVAPLYYRNDYIGFMGFDECFHHRQWTDSEEQTLRNMASIVSTAVSAIRRERERVKMVEVSHSVLNSLSSAVYVAELKTDKILLANSMFRQILPSLTGNACFYRGGDQSTPGFCKMEDMIYHRCPHDDNHCLRDGCVRIVRSESLGKWYKLFIKTITWLDGGTVLLGNFLDITDIKLAEEKMTRLASVDTMTGVLNRSVGLKMVAEAIENCRERKADFALAYIDIDGLKAVNDKYGHKEGDYMIVAVAEALKKAVRDTDMICRLGGDEFLLVLTKCEQGEISTVLSRVENCLEEIVRYNGKPYPIQISHGTYFASGPDTPDLQEMIQICDKRMYTHKRSKGRERRVPAQI